MGDFSVTGAWICAFLCLFDFFLFFGFIIKSRFIASATNHSAFTRWRAAIGSNLIVVLRLSERGRTTDSGYNILG